MRADSQPVDPIVQFCKPFSRMTAAECLRRLESEIKLSEQDRQFVPKELNFEGIIQNAFQPFVYYNPLHIRKGDGNSLPYGIEQMRGLASEARKSWMEIVRDETERRGSWSRKRELELFYDLLIALEDNYSDQGNLTVPPAFIYQIADRFFKQTLHSKLAEEPERKQESKDRPAIQRVIEEKVGVDVRSSAGLPKDEEENISDGLLKPREEFEFKGVNYVSEVDTRLKNSRQIMYRRKKNRRSLRPQEPPNESKLRKWGTIFYDACDDMQMQLSFRDFRLSKVRLRNEDKWICFERGQQENLEIIEDYWTAGGKSISSPRLPRSRTVVQNNSENFVVQPPQSDHLAKSADTAMKGYFIFNSALTLLSIVPILSHIPLLNLLIGPIWNYMESGVYFMTSADWRKAQASLLHKTDRKRLAGVYMFWSTLAAPGLSTWAFVETVLALNSSGSAANLVSTSGITLGAAAFAASSFAFAGAMLIGAAMAHYECRRAQERSTLSGLTLDRLRKHTCLTKQIRELKSQVEKLDIRLERSQSSEDRQRFKTQKQACFQEIALLDQKRTRMRLQAQASYKCMSVPEKTNRPINDPITNHEIIHSIGSNTQPTPLERNIVSFLQEKQKITVKKRETDRMAYLLGAAGAVFMALGFLFPIAVIPLEIMGGVCYAAATGIKFMQINDKLASNKRRERVFADAKKRGAADDSSIRVSLIREYLNITNEEDYTQYLSSEDCDLIIDLQCEKICKKHTLSKHYYSMFSQNFIGPDMKPLASNPSSSPSLA